MSATDDEWGGVATRPDADALGYETVQWEKYPTGRGYLIFLPSDSEDVSDRAYVVADAEALVDPVSRR